MIGSSIQDAALDGFNVLWDELSNEEGGVYLWFGTQRAKAIEETDIPDVLSEDTKTITVLKRELTHVPVINNRIRFGTEQDFATYIVTRSTNLKGRPLAQLSLKPS